jgi:hypothetical protein
MDITFRTGAVHGVSLREVGAIDRCRKVPRQGSHRGRGHHTNRTPPYCAAIMSIACGVRGAERAAVAKCRRKIASRRMLAQSASQSNARAFFLRQS